MFLDLLLLLEKEASHRLTRSVQSSQCQTLYSKTLRGKFAGNRPLSRGGHFSVDLLRLCLHSTGKLLSDRAFVRTFNDDFGAVSVKERSCTVSILKVDLHISDRFLCHTLN